MEAVILAGGIGTRLQPVVPDVPKPMAPVNGRPFLKYQMDYWIRQGVRRFILSIGYRGEIIRSYFGSRYENAEIDYAVEEHPLGTGGGLLLAVRELISSGPFLILNGDTFFEVDLDALQLFHHQKKSEFTIALLKVPVNSRYSGVQVGKESNIVAFEDRKPASSNLLVNGGVYLAEKSAIENQHWVQGDKLSLEDVTGGRLSGHGIG
ncbi:MAG: NTP transferase domain-containing protein [Nitrospirae bacterium]|nr:NTP transferase domain-containing protein [Nitrospirota bacterium]